MREPRQIIKKPLVTEKGTWQQETSNQYAFLVHPKANKVEIKRAVESLFPDVRVTQVRTMLRKGKPRRSFGRFHLTSDFKRALVTLRQGDAIEFI